MASTVEIQLRVREKRPQLWPVARALKPLWGVLPFDVACRCIFTMLGTQYSLNDGKSWKDLRCPK